MELTRRELLALGGLSLFTGIPSWALEADDRYFVLVRTFGGMDVTLGLDPQILPPDADAQDMFVEYRPDEIVSAGGLRLGPSAVALAPHAADCLILNGVMMRRDAGHDVVNLYMATGRGDGKAATLPVELALSLGGGPYGVVMSQSAYLAGKAATLSATRDILADTDPTKLITMLEEKLKLPSGFGNTPLLQAQRKVVESKQAAMSLNTLLKQYLASGEKVDDRHITAAAFAAGAARQAHLDVPLAGIGLDTHSQHEGNHLRAQKGVWEWTAGLFSLFKKAGLFEKTTFMVISEWARTPALNAAKGKDHNPFTNSVLLAGRGVQGGKVIGASRLITRKKAANGFSDHVAWPFDYKEQKLAEGPKGASFFYPENVIRTVGEIFGNPPNFTPVPKTTAIIPGVVKA